MIYDGSYDIQCDVSVCIIILNPIYHALSTFLCVLVYISDKLFRAHLSSRCHLSRRLITDYSFGT